MNSFDERSPVSAASQKISPGALACAAIAGLVSGLGCRPTNLPPTEPPVEIPSLETPATAATPPVTSSPPRRVQIAEPATPSHDRSCCKGQNECKGKGNCKVEGSQDCKGRNECKGKGGCKGSDC